MSPIGGQTEIVIPDNERQARALAEASDDAMQMKKWPRIVLDNIRADVERLSIPPPTWQPGEDRMASLRQWDAHREATQGIVEINWRAWLSRPPTASDLVQGCRAIRSLIDLQLVEPHFHKHATNIKALSLTEAGAAAARELTSASEVSA